jgi:dTDP-4-dehydrorhamnose 3,5-epimerase
MSTFAPEGSIHGVQITQLTQIFDERGKIMHMMSVNSPHFEKFGEIYFSSTNVGVVKAWHQHSKMTLNYAVLVGQMKVVLFDDRKDSPTRGYIQEIFASPENYKLITVPPLVWNGFKNVGDEVSIIANCATIPHDPNEMKRLSPYDSSIPYDWAIHHR